MAQAQITSVEYSITGRITDKEGKAIPFATVQILNFTKGATADADGVFVIEDVAKGEYNLLVKSLGYLAKSIDIKLDKKPLFKIDIILEEDARELDGVIVTAMSEKETLELSAQAVDVIETREVKLRTADLGEVLAQTQGVSIQRSGGLGSDSRLSLNGLSGDKIRFFFNGVPLDFTGYSVGIGNVPVNLVDRVEIYKGVVPVQFGADALGGAVNLVSPPVTEGFQGSISYQTGSFGTHRATLDLKLLEQNTGLLIGFDGFYDFTRNNYEVDVQVPQENGRLMDVTVPRFHDDYEAHGLNLTIGLQNKKWADELKASIFLNETFDEVQHNAVMTGNPFGEVVFTSELQGGNLTYKKNFENKYGIETVFGMNETKRVFVDTSRYFYSWFGERMGPKNLPGEFSGIVAGGSHQFTWDDNYYNRTRLNWNLNDNQSINISLAPTYTRRTGDELLAGTFDPLTAKGILHTWVNGIEYELDLFNNRLQNIAFVKSYWQNIRTEQDIPDTNELSVNERSVDDFGWGNGLRYKISDRIIAKLSYEYALRLPRTDEVFGDGNLIVQNLDLEPERSHNINLSTNIRSRSQLAKTWRIDLAGFYRRINNLIFLVAATDRTSGFDNVYDATSIGAEFAGEINELIKGLKVSANATYQNFYNNSTQGSFERFEGERIPNTPYMFVNSTINYTLPESLVADNDLSIYWSARYVHSFFLGWESSGANNPEFKLTIPSQNIHHAGLIYRVPVRTMNLTITGDVQNILNKDVFDFYGIQRPGRAYYLKMVTQF